MTSVLFQGKPFNITVIQDYASTTDGEEAEVDQFYVKLDDFLELKPKKKKKCPIHHRGLEVGSQEIPGVTGKFGLGIQNEAEQRLTEFCQEKAQVLANTLFQ